MGTQCECRAPVASPASLGTACRETQCSWTLTDGNWRQDSIQFPPGRPQESTHSPRVEQARAPEPWPGSAGPQPCPSLEPRGWVPLHGSMDEVQQGCAVLAPVEAHTQLDQAVLVQSLLDGSQGCCHLLPQGRACQDRTVGACPDHVPLAWPQGLRHFTLWICLISRHIAEPLLAPQPRACSARRSGRQRDRDHEGTGQLWHCCYYCTLCSQTLPPTALAEVTGPIPTCVG